MPVYDYDCAACGRRFEVIHGVHVDGPAACPLCGEGPVRKAISAPAIHYKGSGWAKKERRTAVAPGGSSTTADATAGDDGGPKADTATKDSKDPKDSKDSKDSKDATSSTPASTSTKAPEAGTASRKD